MGWDEILSALQDWLGQRVVVDVLDDERGQLATLSGTLGRSPRRCPHPEGSAFFSVNANGHATGPDGFVLDPGRFNGGDRPSPDYLLVALARGGLIIRLDD